MKQRCRRHRAGSGMVEVARRRGPAIAALRRGKAGRYLWLAGRCFTAPERQTRDQRDTPKVDLACRTRQAIESDRYEFGFFFLRLFGGPDRNLSAFFRIRISCSSCPKSGGRRKNSTTSLTLAKSYGLKI